jgi:hypothetical protein
VYIASAIAILMMLVVFGWVYPVTRLRAWNSYIDLLRHAIDSSESTEPIRHAVAVAEAMEGWGALPAIARIIHGLTTAQSAPSPEPCPFAAAPRRTVDARSGADRRK